MRINITPDPDIATQLRRLSVERGQSFSTTVDEVLRAGIDVRRGTGRPYVEVARDLGVQPRIDMTKALDLALD